MPLDYTDERWVERRKEIFKRDNFQCCNCGSADNLNCHHKKYGETLWGVPDEWLETLCNECHIKRHLLEREIRLMSCSEFFLFSEKMRLSPVENMLTFRDIFERENRTVEQWNDFAHENLTAVEKDAFLLRKALGEIANAPIPEFDCEFRLAFQEITQYANDAYSGVSFKLQITP